MIGRRTRLATIVVVTCSTPLRSASWRPTIRSFGGHRAHGRVELVDLAAQPAIVANHDVCLRRQREGGNVTILDVHPRHRVRGFGVGAGVEGERLRDLRAPATDRGGVEVVEVGGEGALDFGEDATGDDGLVEVVVERTEQQVTRQDRDKHVGVEHRDQPTAHGQS